MSALSRCIAIPAERFADEHWGRLPLLTSRGELAAGFDDLLDASAVDELLSRRGLRTPFLRMAKDGDLVAPKRYTRGGGAGAGAPDQVADDRVLDQLGGGATLVLQGLHRTWPPLVAFASELAAELGAPTVLDPHLRETGAPLHSFLDGGGTDAVAERVAADLTQPTRPAP